jgi:hypothetical protein
MTYRLSSDVHMVTVDDDLVFLDVAADTYFCLPDASSALALRPDGVTLARCDPSLLGELVEAGLVSDGPATAARARPPPPATRDLGALKPPRPGVSDLHRMSGAAMRLYRYGYGASLQRLLRAADVKSPGADAGEEKVIDLAMRCEQMIPWVPLQGECLFRSFLTLSVLRRSGASLSWMFGVQTWPFRAHCWLQRGDLVLNDNVEHVSGYHPILVA